LKKIFGFSVLGWDITIVNRKEGIRLLKIFLEQERQQEYDDYLRDIYEANMNEEKQKGDI